jgi:hypothetical protein
LYNRALRLGDIRLSLPSVRNMQRSKCEFHGQTQAKAEAKLNEWKKANARAVSIIAQIIEMPESDACVIRIEYEKIE